MNSFRISNIYIFTALSTIAISILIIASFFIPFNIFLYIFTVGLASIFIFKKPEVGLYTIIVSTFIFGFSFGLLSFEWNDEAYKLYPIDVLTIITALSFLVLKLKNPDIKIKIGGKLGLLISVFLAFCLFSMIYGVASGGEFSVAFSTFKNYAIYSIFFFLTINIIRGRDKLKELINIFLIGGILLIPFIFLGLFQGSGLFIEFTPLSTEGTRLLAPNQGFNLCIAIIFALNLIAFKKKLFGKLTTIIILVQVIGVVGSLTRHLWIALFCCVVLTFIFLPRERKKNLLEVFAYQGLFLVIIMIIYALGSFILTQEIKLFGLDYLKDAIIRLQSLFNYSSSQDSSVYYRILSWEKAYSLFIGSPIIGIGFGQKLSFDLLGWPIIIEVRELHNNFVGMILQMGILGFLTFLIFNIYFLIKSFALLLKSNEKLFPYILGAIGCYVLYIISANFGTYFDSNIFNIFYWIFLGIIIVIEDIKRFEVKNKIQTV